MQRGYLQDGVTKDTYLLFPSAGYFLVFSLWALKVSKFLLLVLSFSPCVLLGTEYLFWLSSLNVTVCLPALPKLYFLWCLTLSPQLYFLFFPVKFLHILFSLFLLSGYCNWICMIQFDFLCIFQWIYLLSKPLHFFLCSRNQLPFNMYVSCVSFMPIWEHCIYHTLDCLKPLGSQSAKLLLFLLSVRL